VGHLKTIVSLHKPTQLGKINSKESTWLLQITTADKAEVLEDQVIVVGVAVVAVHPLLLLML
jgi:hypothetical protein